MRKVLQIISVLLFVFMSDVVLAQTKLPQTQKAIELYNQGKLIEAKDQVLKALKDPIESKSAFTWQTKAFIYKELYKEVEQESKYSEYREIAVDAVLRSMELDDEKGLMEEHKKALGFLSLSYFNNAVELVHSLTETNYEEAPKFYKRYRQLYPLVDPKIELKVKDAEFFNKYGFELRKLAQKDGQENKVILDKAVMAYENSLAAEPNNEVANHNLAVIHYNQGARKIRSINYQTEIFELITIQDECLQHFKSALPYMEKIYSQDPENLVALKGLMAIYRAMNNDAKSAEFKKEIERLIKSGKAK